MATSCSFKMLFQENSSLRCHFQAVCWDEMVGFTSIDRLKMPKCCLLLRIMFKALHFDSWFSVYIVDPLKVLVFSIAETKKDNLEGYFV